MRRLELRVRQAQTLAPRSPELRGGFLGFLRTGVRIAARAALAAGQVDDREAVPAARHEQQQAAAGQLDVVRVRPEGEQLDEVTRGAHNRTR